MFKRSKYPNANLKASSVMLNQARIKIFEVLILYRYNIVKNKRKNLNYQKEAKVESVYCRKLNEDSNMKIPEMEKIFKENYNVEVSRSTV